MRRVVVVLAACCFLAGCGGREDAAEAGDGRSAEGGASEQSPAPDGAQGPVGAVCLEGPFTGEGAVSVQGGAGGGEVEVGALRWARHEGCERVVIEVGGAAGGPGRIGAEVMRSAGVVRVSLRDARSVASGATDQRFGGPLARGAYAVISPEGGHIYVDVHLGAAAEAHVRALRDPGRVVVDLRPGGRPAGAPRVGQRVVVLTPAGGQASYPLTITGYARTFEANVVARLVRNGEVLHETFTTSTGYIEAWGHYSMTIPEGPSGRVTLQVGEYSAKDGSWEGVDVELSVGN